MLLLVLGTQAALAQGAPGSITLERRGQVLMDGRTVPLNRVKPFLLEDEGSRRRARSAKTLSTLGTVAAISGAALVVLGTVGISDGGLEANGPAYSVAGTGFVVLGAGIGFKIGATRKWRRSVGDYQGP